MQKLGIVGENERVCKSERDQFRDFILVPVQDSPQGLDDEGKGFIVFRKKRCLKFYQLFLDDE